MFSSAIRLMAAVAAFAVLAAGPALAQDAPAPPETEAAAPAAARPWAVQITPYLWAPSLNGRFAASDSLPSVRVRRSFDDLLDTLDAAAFVSGYARTGRAVLMADFTYLSSSNGGDLALPRGRSLRLDASIDEYTATVAGGWRVLQSDLGHLDMLAGVRIWAVDLHAEASLRGVRRVSESELLGFVDPIIAARGVVSLPGPFSVLAYGDIGGFGGLDLSSDFTAQALMTLNLEVTRNFVLSAGYRYLMVDYDQDGELFDVDMSGPMIGATLRF